MLNRQHEDLAVADMSGVRRAFNRADHLHRKLRWHDDFEFGHVDGGERLAAFFWRKLPAALGPAFNIYLLLVVLVVLGFGVMASLWTGPAIEREELVEKDASQTEEPPTA